MSTFDCPQSFYCGGQNCLSVVRNFMGVHVERIVLMKLRRPSSLAALTGFVSLVVSLRRWLASDRPSIFTKCINTAISNDTVRNRNRIVRTPATVRSQCSFVSHVRVSHITYENYRHYLSRRFAFKISRRSIRRV